MARRRSFLANFGYSTLGFLAVAAIGYGIYAARRVAANKATDSSMMDVRRATRDAGRAVKDATTHATRDIGRAGTDLGRTVKEAVAENTGSSPYSTLSS